MQQDLKLALIVTFVILATLIGFGVIAIAAK
jgi:hypothetical protein